MSYTLYWISYNLYYIFCVSALFAIIFLLNGAMKNMKSVLESFGSNMVQKALMRGLKDPATGTYVMMGWVFQYKLQGAWKITVFWLHPEAFAAYTKSNDAYRTS